MFYYHFHLGFIHAVYFVLMKCLYLKKNLWIFTLKEAISQFVKPTLYYWEINTAVFFIKSQVHVWYLIQRFLNVSINTVVLSQEVFHDIFKYTCRLEFGIYSLHKCVLKNKRYVLKKDEFQFKIGSFDPLLVILYASTIMSFWFFIFLKIKHT